MTKRLSDVLIASVALFLLIPLLIPSALLVKATSRGKLLFRQTRIGLGERPFEILKLRTMHVDKDRVSSQTLPGDPGIIPGGAILRRLKIDEIPQLVNVLKGDMSLVGPRPCLLETARAMPDWARQRFQVKPGLTGLAQVNGNIALSWEERWRHDVHYASHQSFALDLIIMVRTVLVVTLGEERFRRPI